jgi:hypothetical protein
VVPLVNVEVGMDPQFFTATDDMVAALQSIGITMSDHTLYLTITPTGGVRIIPINLESDNEYNRTKQLGLITGIRAVGSALHRSGEQSLQGVPCT